MVTHKRSKGMAALDTKCGVVLRPQILDGATHFGQRVTCEACRALMTAKKEAK